MNAEFMALFIILQSCVGCLSVLKAGTAARQPVSMASAQARDAARSRRRE